MNSDPGSEKLMSFWVLFLVIHCASLIYVFSLVLCVSRGVQGLMDTTHLLWGYDVK